MEALKRWFTFSFSFIRRYFITSYISRYIPYNSGVKATARTSIHTHARMHVTFPRATHAHIHRRCVSLERYIFWSNSKSIFSQPTMSTIIYTTKDHYNVFKITFTLQKIIITNNLLLSRVPATKKLTLKSKTLSLNTIIRVIKFINLMYYRWLCTWIPMHAFVLSVWIFIFTLLFVQ